MNLKLHNGTGKFANCKQTISFGVTLSDYHFLALGTGLPELSLYCALERGAAEKNRWVFSVL